MGMLGTVLATNLIEFYVFFELMLVPSFFLLAFYGYGARKRIALMFFFWTHVGAVVLLLGLLAMGFFAGGFDYDTVRSHVAQIPANWMPVIIFSLVIGLGVKLAAFVLHIWLPVCTCRSSHSNLRAAVASNDRDWSLRIATALARLASRKLFTI
jgi:NADH-quinone oxidoreductase subunit M